MKRTYWRFTARVYLLVMPLLGLELYLNFTHHKIASLIPGVLLLGAIAYCFLWARRHGLRDTFAKRRRT